MKDIEHNTWRLPGAMYHVFHWAPIRLVTFDVFDSYDPVDTVDIKNYTQSSNTANKNYNGPLLN